MARGLPGEGVAGMKARTPWGFWWRLCRLVCLVLDHRWMPDTSPFPGPAEYCPRCLECRPTTGNEEAEMSANPSDWKPGMVIEGMDENGQIFSYTLQRRVREPCVGWGWMVVEDRFWPDVSIGMAGGHVVATVALCDACRGTGWDFDAERIEGCCPPCLKCGGRETLNHPNYAGKGYTRCPG